MTNLLQQLLSELQALNGEGSTENSYLLPRRVMGGRTDLPIVGVDIACKFGQERTPLSIYVNKETLALTSTRDGKTFDVYGIQGYLFRLETVGKEYRGKPYQALKVWLKAPNGQLYIFQTNLGTTAAESLTSGLLAVCVSSETMTGLTLDFFHGKTEGAVFCAVLKGDRRFTVKGTPNEFPDLQGYTDVQRKDFIIGRQLKAIDQINAFLSEGKLSETPIAEDDSFEAVFQDASDS